MKLNKKIMLSAFAGASAVGAITPALVTTAYANDKFVIPNHVYQSEDDLKYGLDDSTYLEVKQNLTEAREKQLFEKGYQKDSKVWKQEMSIVQTTLTAFDNISKTQNCSYTQLTTAVVNYARSEYKIPLIRTTNAKWNDITDMFNGTLNSVTLYMDHEHLPLDVQKMVIANATSKFNATLTELEKQNYKECDPYGAMIEVRKEMLSFFDVLNAQVAKLSASIKLSTFIQKYKVVPKQNGTKYSELKDLKVGQPITNINDILMFVNPETGVETTFVGDRMIPGYTIVPKFAGFTVDKEKNHYGINIDWAATANHYVNTNEALDAEGHIYDVMDPSFKANMDELKKQIDNVKTADHFDEQFAKTLNKLKVSPQSYAISETKKGMNDSILAAYFNENGLTFEWPTSMDENTRLEPFYSQYDSATHQGVATMQDLADAGLKVSEIINGQKVTRYLSEVIKSAQTKKDTNTFTLAEKFVANCNVYSLTQIGDETSLVSPDGHINEKSTVQNTFYITYANIVNHKLNAGNKNAIKEFVLNSIELEDWVILPENKQPGACIDYVTSEQYFFNLCEKYTAVKDSVDFLASIEEELNKAISKFSEIKAWQYFHVAVSITNLAAGLFITYYASTRKVVDDDPDVIKSDTYAKLFGLLDVFVSLIHFVLAVISIKDFSTIITTLKNIRIEYEKEITEKGLKPILEKLQTRIAEDDNVLTLIRTQPKKDPVIVDKADYDKKLQQYYQKPFEDYKSMLNFYGNFEWSKAGLGTAEVNIVTEFTNKFNEIFINLNKWLVGTSATNGVFEPFKSVHSLVFEILIFTIISYLLLGAEIVFLIVAAIYLKPIDDKAHHFMDTETGLTYTISASIIPMMIAYSIAAIEFIITVVLGVVVFSKHISFMIRFNTRLETEETIPENIDLK